MISYYQMAKYCICSYVNLLYCYYYYYYYYYHHHHHEQQHSLLHVTASYDGHLHHHHPSGVGVTLHSIWTHNSTEIIISSVFYILRKIF